MHDHLKFFSLIFYVELLYSHAMRNFGGKLYVLSDRDQDILVTLTHKVRLLTLSQVATTWWPSQKHSERSAERGLAKVAKLGLVDSDYVMARPFLPLDEPVQTWKPGEPLPDFAPVACQLRARWRDRPYRSVRVFFATRTAVNQYGGFMGGCLDHTNEATHDLHHAEVFLRLKRAQPILADSWISEQQLAKDSEPLEVLPDSVLCDPNGQPRLVIEFAGIYNEERLERLHRYAEERDLPYEFW